MGKKLHMKGYVTTRELAERLGVAQVTVKSWCQRGLLAGAVKAGSGRRAMWLIPEAALEEFEPPGRRPKKTG